VESEGSPLSVVTDLSCLSAALSPGNSSIPRQIAFSQAFRWAGYGPAADSCQHENEPSDSMKWEEFLNQLSDYQLLVSYFVFIWLTT
jgi:hypothetical protein